MGTDVVVVGAGPNGLMLAAELAMRGVRVVVLERATRPDTAARANGLAGQVVRLIDQRGLYRDLSIAGRSRLPLMTRVALRAQRNHPVPVKRYQYGGFDLDLRHLPDNPLFVLPVAQRQMESLLERRCDQLGVRVRRGHELTALDADSDGVHATIGGPDGTYQLRSAYLVGCDGAHSAVRKRSGIGFSGDTSTAFVSRNGHVRLPRSALSTVAGAVTVPGRDPLRPYQFHRTPTGAFSFAPQPGGLHLVNTYVWDPHSTDDEEPMTLAELTASLRHVLGTDLGAGPPEGFADAVLRRTAARNTRMADRYRCGRVFIAGDAAHVFTGFGGPGLNLGLTDVVNLGWKLAAAISGRAPAGLLDTYATERMPQAAEVLRQTREQAALLAPGPEADELRREFAARIATPAGLRHVVDVVAGTAVAYHMPGAPRDPLVGLLAPDRTVVSSRGRTRLAVLQRQGQALLLDPTPDRRHAAVARDRPEIIQVRATGAPAMLVRPDGYVAWAAPADGTSTGLGEALHSWFGSP